MTVFYEGLVHVPKRERNIFVDADYQWWNTRCTPTWSVLVEWSRDELIEGAVITCWWCLVDVMAYKARFGRYPT